MPISREELQGVAKLAKLQFNDKDLTKMTKNFEIILNYVNQLKEIDIEKIKPMEASLEMRGRMRDDEVEDSLSIEEVLGNAPDKQGNYFRLSKKSKP